MPKAETAGLSNWPNPPEEVPPLESVMCRECRDYVPHQDTCTPEESIDLYRKGHLVKCPEDCLVWMNNDKKCAIVNFSELG